MQAARRCPQVCPSRVKADRLGLASKELYQKQGIARLRAAHREKLSAVRKARTDGNVAVGCAGEAASVRLLPACCDVTSRSGASNRVWLFDDQAPLEGRRERRVAVGFRTPRRSVSVTFSLALC